MAEKLASVRNAARLLKEFSREDRELGVSELARRLGLGTSTTHRLLATLTEERLLERGQARGTYRLGIALHDLGAAVASHLDLHEAAMPAMAALRHTTGETVQLAVLDGLDSVYVERLESPHTVRITSIGCSGGTIYSEMPRAISSRKRAMSFTAPMMTTLVPCSMNSARRSR